MSHNLELNQAIYLALIQNVYVAKPKAHTSINYYLEFYTAST